MMEKILYLFCIILLISCSGNKRKEQRLTESATATTVQKDSFPKSVVITNVVSIKNPSYSYTLFLPHQYGDSSRIPVLIFFDPHADGSMPLTKYKEIAERFGVVLIGSNDSKNGLNFDQTNSIVQSLVEEVKQRLSIDSKQISLCGFSGGAKVALVAAMHTQQLLSIVYCGAGLPPQQVTSLPPALGFAGLRDLNYTEVIETDQAMQDKKNPHGLVTWNGKHEWPDSMAFQDAFYWIRFRAMENKSALVDNELVNEFKKKNSKVLQNTLDEWWRLKKLISFVNGVADVSEYLSQHEALIKKKEFNVAIQKFKNEMDFEQQMKQSYYDAISQKDISWWKTEIERLKKEKGPNTMMNQRLLGYISLMCYSLSNSDMKQGNNTEAAKVLSIYKLADPENPDQAYLQACFYAINHNENEALMALQKAMHLGFNDKTKLIQEEAFAPLRNTARFNEIANETATAKQQTPN